MARFNEQSKVPDLPDQEGVRHFGDGIAGPITASRLQGYDSSTLGYVDVAVDAAGQLKTTGGAGGGGAATIADGADVAEGATTDAVWVSGGAGSLVAISKYEAQKIEAVRALLAGTIAVSGPLTDAQLRATPVPVSGTVATGGLTDTQLRASAVPVSGPLTDAQLRAAAVPVSMATQTPDVIDRVGRLLGHVSVDNFPGTQPVSLAAAVDVSDRVGRLLGVVDKGKLWDGTNIAAVKAASAIAAAADPALVVQHSPQRADAGTLVGTTISGANATVTLTIASGGAGLFHYITSIEIIAINPTITAIAAAASTLAFTTTNLNGLVWDVGTALAAGAEKVVTRLTPATPIKSQAAATATTIVAPAIGTGGVVRIQVTYYTAP